MKYAARHGNALLLLWRKDKTIAVISIKPSALLDDDDGDDYDDVVR
jgi:hypothetical protein